MVFIKFDGAGWLFPFYFGAAQYLSKRIDMEDAKVKVGGVSAGSVVATMLLLRVDFEKILKEILNEYDIMKYNPFLIKNCLRNVLSQIIPQETSVLDNKLVIGVSYLDLLKRVWRSDTLESFSTRKTCIDALTASCHIPVISGIFPYYVNGVGYYDGELADFTPPSKNSVEVGLSLKAGTINPGIHLPEIWKYYPVDPYILLQLFRLGYLRAKEYYKETRIHDRVEIEKILNILRFCIRTGHVQLWSRLMMTVLLYSPRWLTLSIIAFCLTKTFKRFTAILKVYVKERRYRT